MKNTRKRSLAILLAALMALSASALAGAAQTSKPQKAVALGVGAPPTPGEMAGAAALTEDVPAAVSLTQADPYMVFQFTPAENGAYVFFSDSEDNADIDPYGTLYSGEPKLLRMDDDSGGNLNFRIRHNLQAGQAYYLIAGSYSGDSTGSYKVTVSKAVRPADVSPVIIVPGLFQSQVCICDETGEFVLDAQGNPIEYNPLSALYRIDMAGLVKSLVWPAIGTVLFRCDMGLSEKLTRIVSDALETLSFDENGLPLRLRPRVVMQSMADCSPEDYYYASSEMPIGYFESRIGAENIYFFSYDSFGNLAQTTQALYDFIQHVKADSGSGKVNLLAASQGGSIATALFEEYPGTKNDLDKVMLAIIASLGTSIVSDLMGGLDASFILGYLNNFLYGAIANALYSAGYYSFLEKAYPYIPPIVMDCLYGFPAKLTKWLMGLLPSKVIDRVAGNVLAGMTAEKLSHSTSFWALCPPEEYPALRGKLLGDAAHAGIRGQTDRYYDAQLHFKQNIADFQGAGVKIYDLVCYNLPLNVFGMNGGSRNSDGVIPAEAASFGAVFGPVDTPLPAGYTQAVNDGHNHISPDGIVDASTGALPEHTWYFKGVEHGAVGWEYIFRELIAWIATSPGYVDVFTTGEWPQFIG